MKYRENWIELCEEKLKRRVLYISVSAEHDEIYESVLEIVWRGEEDLSSEDAIVKRERCGSCRQLLWEMID